MRSAEPTVTSAKALTRRDPTASLARPAQSYHPETPGFFRLITACHRGRLRRRRSGRAFARQSSRRGNRRKRRGLLLARRNGLDFGLRRLSFGLVRRWRRLGLESRWFGLRATIAEYEQERTAAAENMAIEQTARRARGAFDDHACCDATRTEKFSAF